MWCGSVTYYVFSCNMGTHDLPDMYALNPQACSPQALGIASYVCTYWANLSCPCMLQLLHVTVLLHIIMYVTVFNI